MATRINFKIAKNYRWKFVEDPWALWTIQAVGRRYAVLTRQAHEKDCKIDPFLDDSDPIDRMYIEKYPKIGETLYTIWDIDNMTRGPHNLLMNVYNFETQEGCQEVCDDLHDGKIELSKRPKRCVNVIATEG